MKVLFSSDFETQCPTMLKVSSLIGLGDVPFVGIVSQGKNHLTLFYFVNLFVVQLSSAYLYFSI